MKNEILKKEMNYSDKDSVYRKLLYFYENKIPIHFSLITGGWCNGHIKELNESSYSIVLTEFVRGELVFVCEEIKLESIAKFNKPIKE